VSVLFASSVAGVYVVGVVGLHRLNVMRQRRASGGFPCLAWLDWDSLLEGILPESKATPATESKAVGGGPLPSMLAAKVPPETTARHAILSAIVGGHVVDERAIETAGFSGGQSRWVRTLSYLVYEPERALERLTTGTHQTSGELYLREWLELSLRTHAFNLELQIFSTKRRLALGIARYGEQPALYFARARASALIGFNKSAVDDLARAVYFSRQSAFYLRAVLETPYIEEARPALVNQVKLAVASQSPLSR
jgi:hypothetical protein